MRVPCANVEPRPAAGEGDCFSIHAVCLSVTIPGKFRRHRKTLASTSPSPPNLRKIVKKRSQGATPQHRTLLLPNIARCDTTTSHPATLSHHTLRHRAIAPCHFRLSHPATQKARFLPLKSSFPPSFRRSERTAADFQNPTSPTLSACGGRGWFRKLSIVFLRHTTNTSETRPCRSTVN